MKGWFRWLWFFCLVWASATVFADGGFAPATALEQIRIPDQRALIHFDKGNEILVIDTAFKAQGTNFAWIIPVPSVPLVEPATTGLFTTLQTIFQPKIIHDIRPVYAYALVGGLMLIYALWRLHRGEIPELLVYLLILLIFIALLLPGLGPAGSNSLVSTTVEGVDVIDRKRVGSYDTATLSSQDGKAIFQWLKENGFVAPTNFIPAIQAYAREGWCFVASKVQLEAPLPGGGKVLPLALTFKTDRPVYPLRLTGIDNEACRIELYVFGPSRAELPNFKVERCAAPSYPPLDARHYRQLDMLRIRHPLLRHWVEGSPAATKLVGQLSSRMMKKDAYIAWTPLKEERLTRYTQKGAAVRGANWSVPILMLGLLGWMVSSWGADKEAVKAAKASRVSLMICVAAVGLGGLIYVCLPKVKAVVTRSPEARMVRIHEHIGIMLRAMCADPETRKIGKFRPDLAWARRQLSETSHLRIDLGNSFQTNLFTGELMREEDSPGNYTLRECPGGIEYVWYRLDGSEEVEPLLQEME